MTQTIEIAGGLVSLVDRTVQYSVPMSEWLTRIEKRNPIVTPVLPLGTRAVYWDPTDATNQTLVVLIEEQPKMIRMNLNGITHELSIPYTRFFFYAKTSDPTNMSEWRLNDYKIFWSKTQYGDPNKRDMIRALLPNVYVDGRICFGSTAANAAQSLAQRLNQTVNEFYVSEFNNDLVIRRPNNARTYREWVRMTASNPTGWTEWNDWNESMGLHEYTSYNDLVSNNIDRFAPMLAAEPIEAIPLGASFGRLREWLDTLEAGQKSRLLQTMIADQATSPDTYATNETADEDDDAE